MLKKASKIIGNNLVFRDARVDDADFILALRTKGKAGKFLSSTENDIEKQKQWLLKYANDDTQAYFIIQNKHGENVGTVRLYDQEGDSFCWGSWILLDGIPSTYSIESALIIYSYAALLGFKRSHFDVRKENLSVWRFHEKFGAKRVKETTLDYFYTISENEIQLSLKKYIKFLPHELDVDF